MTSSKAAIFLDRDGTINSNKNGYLYKPEDCELLPGVVEGLQLLAPHFLFFIVTNQSGIGRGYYSEVDFWRFQERLVTLLSKHNITITETYFCPHHPEDRCLCRKPEVKLVEEAIQKYDINRGHSWFIGDSISDMEVSKNAHLSGILLTEDGKKCTPEHRYRCAADLKEAALIIKEGIAHEHET